MPVETPEWVQQLLWLGAGFGAIIGGVSVGRKKAKPDETKGEGVLLAGSFMERQAMIDLTTSIRNLDGTMRETLELTREMHREQEIERAVRSEMAKRKGDL